MEDQFGGRTDDDLFADDFEPVSEEGDDFQEPPPDEPGPIPSDTAIPAAAPPRDATTSASPPSRSQDPSPPAPSASAASATAPTATATTAATPVATTAPSTPSAPKSLAQSRHNKPPPSAPSGPSPSSSRKQQQRRRHGNSSPAPKTETSAGNGASSHQPPSSPPSSSSSSVLQGQLPAPGTGIGASGAAAPAKPEKHDAAARLQSGANPRTKPTEEELAAKIDKMRLLSAERTRRFEKAQRDESAHAIAYERGMEEARRRRAADEEKRRRNEEERRQMDEERATNRQRKLRAIGLAEAAGGAGAGGAGGGSGWDLGRDHQANEAADDRRNFRSANGGVRGARRSGLSGSMFADVGDIGEDERRDFGGERGGRGRGRGRGRGGGGFGRGGGGRGGRGGVSFNAEGKQQQSNRHGRGGLPASATAPPTADDFPALPPAAAQEAGQDDKADGQAAKNNLPPAIQNPLSPLYPAPLTGKWDDEMAAMDAKQDPAA